MLTAPHMPNTVHNQELRLEQMQGSGGLLAPLHSMPALRTQELASCHLNDAQALHAALRAATGLAALRIQVGGLCDRGRQAGMGSACLADACCRDLNQTARVTPFIPPPMHPAQPTLQPRPSHSPEASNPRSAGRWWPPSPPCRA